MKKRLSIFDSAKPLIKGEAEELPALPKSLIERGVYADDGQTLRDINSAQIRLM